MIATSAGTRRVRTIPRARDSDGEPLAIICTTMSGLVVSDRNEIARISAAHRIQPGHLLHGVLAADHGRVPRALRIAGIDIDELRARV